MIGNHIESINDHARNCPKFDLSLHYLYYKSNKNVICEYFIEPDYFINEPQTNKFDLFNCNFCPYCSIEFWVKEGGKMES